MTTVAIDIDLTAAPVNILFQRGDDLSYALRLTNPARFVRDAVIEAGEVTLESATANFSAADVESVAQGPGIPAGTTIATVVDASNATLSDEATDTDEHHPVLIYTPVPIDIEGGTGLAQIRASSSLDDTNILATFTVTCEAGGWLTLELSAEAAAELPRKAFWDLQITKDGVTRTYLAGEVRATPDVSRVEA